MRKIKFKKKTNKVFFSTRFFILIFIAIIVFTSSAYAVLNETLTLTGRISGQTVYTYYFEKYDNLESNTEVTASDSISNVQKWVKYIEK